MCVDAICVSIPWPMMGHCCIFKKITPNPPMLSGVMRHTICQFILYFYDIYVQVCTQKLRCEENNGV